MSSEPRNPFYFFLLLAGLVFTVTALAYAGLPVLEEKATAAGNPPPPSEFRDALRADGWRWLLYEVGVLIFFGLASMVYDRLLTLKIKPPGGTIPPITTKPDP
jgi:hypothetical protein